MAENFTVVLQGLYLDPEIPRALYIFDVAVNAVFSIITIFGNVLIMVAQNKGYDLSLGYIVIYFGALFLLKTWKQNHIICSFTLRVCNIKELKLQEIWLMNLLMKKSEKKGPPV